MLDNSQCLQYRACPLSHHLKYHVGLEKIQEGEVEHDRNFGGAIHVALEVWHKGGTRESALGAFREAYPDQLDESDLAKTQANGETMLATYFKRYANDFEKYKILAVEEKIEFTVDATPYAVKCDTVVQDKKYGSIYGLDNKTTKEALTFDYWSQYEPNSQICSQTAGIKERFGECAGIIINAMSFGYRQRAYKGEPAGFHMDFGRMEYNITDAQLEIWRKSVMATVRNMAQDDEMTSYAMNTAQCRFCSFKSICQAGWTWPEDEELILLNYQINPNPLEYLEPHAV